jgi:hypothetical protein
MIEPNTVFILGAGASKPYGFPLGTELRLQIIQALSSPNTEQFKLLQACGYEASQISRFHDDLHDALHDTIDDFLSDRPTHREIGSHAIAIALMNCEDHRRVFPKRDWYPHLFRLLDFKHDRQELEGIVTLNYDRSLEHYLANTIAVSYEGDVKTKAERRFKDFPIFHVHGRLGEYPNRPYQKKADVTDIRAAAAELRITSDADLDSSPVYAAARELCGKASTIVFLGFGYHMRVINRLGLLEAAPTRKFLGSSHGVHPKQRQALEDRFEKRLSLERHGYEAANYFVNVLMQ